MRRSGSSLRLGVRAGQVGFEVAVGASVAIDGACLTVESCSGDLLFFTAVYETLARTTLAEAGVGKKVNLERALAAGGRLDGHIVLGHVDGVGQIVNDRPVGVGVHRTIRVPRELLPLIAVKGSVAIDGVSLTVAGVADDTISVALIPTTMAQSTTGALRPGDQVNIECDVLARYVDRLMQFGRAMSGSATPESQPGGEGSRLLDMMKRGGF